MDVSGISVQRYKGMVGGDTKQLASQVVYTLSCI